MSLVGALISAPWFLIHRRAVAYLERYENLSRRIESKLFDGYDEAYSLTHALADMKTTNKPSVRSMMRWTAIGSLVGWILAFAVFTVRSVGCP